MNPVHQRAWWGGAVYDNDRDSMAWESFETLEVSLQGFAMKKVMYRWSKCQKMFFKNWNRAAVSDFMQVLVECCSVVAALSCQMSLQLYTLTPFLSTLYIWQLKEDSQVFLFWWHDRLFVWLKLFFTWIEGLKSH